MILQYKHNDTYKNIFCYKTVVLEFGDTSKKNLVGYTVAYNIPKPIYLYSILDETLSLICL